MSLTAEQLDEAMYDQVLVELEYEIEGQRYREVRTEEGGLLLEMLRTNAALVPKGSDNKVALLSIKALQVVTNGPDPIPGLVPVARVGVKKLRAKKPKGRNLQLTLDEELYQNVMKYAEMQRLNAASLIRNTLFKLVMEDGVAKAAKMKKSTLVLEGTEAATPELAKMQAVWKDSEAKKKVAKKVGKVVAEEEPQTEAQADAESRAMANMRAAGVIK